MSKAEDKLYAYLMNNFGLYELLELWEQLPNGLISCDEMGIIDRMIYDQGVEPILTALSGPLIKGLTSKIESERQEALAQMNEMGYEL